MSLDKKAQQYMKELPSVTEHMNISSDKSQQHYIKEAIHNLMEFIKPPLLDIGCGDGWTLNYFKTEKKIDEIYGITISPTDACNASRLYDINLELGDMCDIQAFKPASFKTIWSRHSIEHSISPFIALKEMQRLLASDGLIMLIVPMPTDVLINADSHLYTLTHPQWLNLFKKSGLNPIFHKQNDTKDGFAEMYYILQHKTGEKNE